MWATHRTLRETTKRETTKGYSTVSEAVCPLIGRRSVADKDGSIYTGDVTPFFRHHDRSVIFIETPLSGAFVIDVNPSVDERGFFARVMCAEAFAERSLNAVFVQQSISWNPIAGTLRGLHFQVAPDAEEKLVRVTQGSIFDVIVDLRHLSATFGKWFGIELSAENRRQVYIPKGFAHGFQVMQAGSEVLYEITVPYAATAARGIRWSDPDLAIKWPDAADRLIGERDRNLPLFADFEKNL